MRSPLLNEEQALPQIDAQPRNSRFLGHRLLVAISFIERYIASFLISAAPAQSGKIQ